MSLCPSLRFSPRLGSDLGSEAPGLKAFALLPNPSRAVVFPEEEATTFGGGSAAYFLVLLALPELLVVEETWYVTLTQEIGKRIAGIHGVDHKNCCWQRIFGNLHVLNLIAVGIREAIAEDY